jgi:protein TonB
MAIPAWISPAAAQVGEPPAAEAPRGIFAPRLLRKVEPEYTPEARQAGISGIVVVSLAVRTDGSVDNAKVVRGLGYGLDEKAIECVKQWEFKPGEKDGKPVEVAAHVELKFSPL